MGSLNRKVRKMQAAQPIPPQASNPQVDAKVVIAALNRAKQKAQDDALQMEVMLSQRIANLEGEVARLMELCRANGVPLNPEKPAAPTETAKPKKAKAKK